MKHISIFTLALLLTALVAATPALGANIVINNVDGPGIGFNDPTPVAPVGGNPATTLGEQRLVVFEFAADLWGAVLASDVDIVIQATFQPLACSPTGGTLGAAGALQIFAFPSSVPGVVPFTWYHVALANALVGTDVTPGPPDPGLFQPPFADDIFSFFNGAIGTDPNCLTGIGWYNGLDNDEAPNEIDLLAVVMHEFAHGLGFSEFVSEGSGALLGGLPDIYSRNMLDTTLGLTWDQMTDAERLASQVNTGNLVWAGANATAAAPLVLDPRPTVQALNPKSLKGPYEAQAATFGPALRSNGGTTGKVVLADDGTGTPSDACEAIQNNLNGKVALVDRGGCSFVTKALNAEAAGAKGVIVANNLPAGLPPMGGSSSAVGIPSVGVSQATGDAFKAVLPGNMVVKLIIDADFGIGADPNGLVRLYAPNPVAPGSSKSHWDTSATPNLLMEPFINGDLAPASDLDLTPFLFLDLGWTLEQ